MKTIKHPYVLKCYDVHEVLSCLFLIQSDSLIAFSVEEVTPLSIIRSKDAQSIPKDEVAWGLYKLAVCRPVPFMLGFAGFSE